MGRFTTSFKYTNDDTISDQIKEYRKKLEEDAKKKGAIGTVADGDIRITAKQIKSDNGGTTTITNPLDKFSAKDAFKLNDFEQNHYLRFGALLEFLVNNIIPITTDSRSTPMIDISTEPWYNYMYSLPNQISLDPRVCLVRNSKFDTYGSGITNVLGEIPYFFKEIDNGASTNENSAYPLNIYLNFEFIKECLKADEKGNVSVYELISNICTGLNKALGGVNNLEPIIDEETNTLQIIDTTPIPGHSAAANFKGYLLQIYGYDKIANDYISNFVRKVDLKTVIDPGFATMVTVGATAGGYVKGTEATAFSRWNTGLVDRFKEKFIPPKKDKTTAETNKDEPALIYKEEFAGPKGISSRYGFTSFTAGSFKLSDNFIEKNISIVTEYYKWLIAKNAEDSTVSGGTVGFIPFKLGLTLDGISGIKIYNVLRVNTEFLPKAYGKTVDLIVTGVSHRLNNSDWETSIEATVMPKTGEMALVAITAEQAEETLNEATKTQPPKRWPYYSDSDSVPLDIESPSKGNPPNYNVSVSFSDSIKKKYFPIIKSISNKSKGIKLLALVMAQKEGFFPNSRSYKTNNPGNIGNTDSGANSKLATLEEGIKKQINYLYNVAIGNDKNYPLNKEKNIKPFYSQEIDKNQKNYNLTPYLPGYKFKYTGTLEQFVKIYSTGARGGNSYLSIIISYFRKNGFNNVTEKTTLAELIKLNNSSDIIL